VQAWVAAGIFPISASGFGYVAKTSVMAAPAGAVKVEVRIVASSLNGMIFVDDFSLTGP
jgi:hypothetical protein